MRHVRDGHEELTEKGLTEGTDVVAVVKGCLADEPSQNVRFWAVLDVRCLWQGVVEPSIRAGNAALTGRAGPRACMRGSEGEVVGYFSRW